jgi:hypothetical protein
MRDVTTTNSDGEKPARTWLRLSVVIVIVLLVAQWGDRQLRQHEFQTLLDRSAQAQTTVTDAAAMVLSTRQYTMPLLVTSSSATVRAGLEKLVEQDAAKAALRIRTARDQVARLDVLPWHSSARAAHRAALAYLDQRIADFDRVAAGADLSLLDSPEAEATGTVALTALQGSAPSVADSHEAQVVFGPSS